MNSESPRAGAVARPDGAAGGLSAAGAMPDQAVSVKGLTKTYKAAGKAPAKLALSSVDLDIPRGSLFGLLGPNGAGKSTLINILAGLVNKTAGSATVWGYDIDKEARQARAAIGVVPQELNVDPFFTPRELLELQAGLYGVPPAERISDQILAAMGLADKAEAYARTLSGGMRRRLMVAKAMVHQPPVLVLDEPTAGVDIELRQQLWANVRELNRAGTTVLLTTHYLEEAEELCDRIAIINHGKVIACDRTESLLARLDNKALTLIFDRDLPDIPPALAPFSPEQTAARRLLFRYHASDSPVPQILDAVCGAGLSVIDMSTEETDLEDIFLQLTRGAHDGDTHDGNSGTAA
ncbi:ABC transporter ATP-binding protein [Pelagibius litoralis]|uniref:ABC transporter ATP-binding protein n=2 Tax=Pelagibius litoralis TaxID=374515 RepID=A0A967C462_9PROT|nr:ABC transporter ATP-binding protein [Pelagibius litoralis]